MWHYLHVSCVADCCITMIFVIHCQTRDLITWNARAWKPSTSIFEQGNDNIWGLPYYITVDEALFQFSTELGCYTYCGMSLFIHKECAAFNSTATIKLNKNLFFKYKTVFRDHWRLLSTDVTKFEKITLRGILPTNNGHPPLQIKNCPLGCVNIAYSQKSKNLGFLSYST